jgi:methyltransferase
MIPAVVLLGAVTAERLAELWLARRNTAGLLAKGAREFAPSHYPAIVLLHAFWLAGLWIFGWTHPLSSLWLMIFLYHLHNGLNRGIFEVSGGNCWLFLLPEV